jgi:hypothetical protein
VSDPIDPALQPTVANEPLQLADQSPVYPAAARPAPAKNSHIRTILEVVGGVVAVALILGAGAVGFVVGHATSDRGEFTRSSMSRDANGPQGPSGGMLGGQGLGGMPGGQDSRGVDPDGDNWTGGGMMGGGQGLGGQGLGSGMLGGGMPGDGMLGDED